MHDAAKGGGTHPEHPADRRLTAILDSLLLETFMDIRAVKEKKRLQGVLEMAGAAAHHLGQSLQILLTGAEYLLRHALPEDPAEVVAEMLAAARRLKTTIHRIQNITCYATETYLPGRRIVDIDRSSPP